jgi:TPR repeat protein
MTSACVKLGKLYLEADGTPKQLAEGQALLQRACDQRLGSACYALGRSYHTGLGVKKNLDRALELYRRACGCRPQVRPACELVAEFGW